MFNEHSNIARRNVSVWTLHLIEGCRCVFKPTFAESTNKYFNNFHRLEKKRTLNICTCKCQISYLRLPSLNLYKHRQTEGNSLGNLLAFICHNVFLEY